jgi:hypothetical protein
MAWLLGGITMTLAVWGLMWLYKRRLDKLKGPWIAM